MQLRNFVILLLLVLLGAAGYVIFQSEKGPKPGEACTMEALVCPDGSSVGRVPPSCDFAPCPEPAPEDQEDPTENWQTSVKEGVGSFRYPETLPATHVTAPDWPPQMAVRDEPFTCTEAGAPDQAAGKTEKRSLDGREYCVTERREGAAGSVYSLWAYAFLKDGRTVIFSFSTRAVQCGNFSEPERQACEAEQRDLDLDRLIDTMAETVELAPAGQ